MKKSPPQKVVDSGPDIKLGGAYSKAFAMLPPDRKAYWAERLVAGKPKVPAAPAPGTPGKRKVKVVRDEDGAITGFETE